MKFPKLFPELAALAISSMLWATMVSAQGDARRGEYLARAGGCVGCHTEDKDGAVPFAGGRALKTPFGTFYGPNITPDARTGIGLWKEADFVRAMRHGVRPDGANFFPAFPFPSFTNIADSDLQDLWAYLRSLPASTRPSRPHELRPFFGWRFLVTFWKWLYFTPGPLASVPGESAAVSRGAYLVKALGHCGECHTPRNFLGGPVRDRFLGGSMEPGGKRIPNITPTRLRKWTDAELKEFFQTGATPDGDAASGSMDEVVRNTTSKLKVEDVASLIAYLRTIPPRPENAR